MGIKLGHYVAIDLFHPRGYLREELSFEENTL